MLISVNMFSGAAAPIGAPHQERPAAPQHDRRREPELQPCRPRRLREPHGEHEHQHASGSPTRKPPAHVDEFGVRPGVGARLDRLERHAAEPGKSRGRAAARPDAWDR